VSIDFLKALLELAATRGSEHAATDRRRALGRRRSTELFKKSMLTSNPCSCFSLRLRDAAQSLEARIVACVSGANARP